MINTGGYGINVLPQYTPVDASLAAFNPAIAAQGAGQAVDIAHGLEQLSNMRQIHEETAKMSAAKNKLLDAQAEEARITTQHLADVRDAKLAADLATLKHKEATSKLDLPNVEARANVEAGSLKNQLDLQPGAGRIGIMQQVGLEKATPFLSDALVTNAQTAAGASSFGLRQQGARQAVESYKDASALDTAPDQMTAAKIKADADVVNAQANLARARVDFSKGMTGKEELDNAHIALMKAQEKQAISTADAMSGKNATAIAVAQARAEKQQNDEKALQVVGNQLIRYGNVDVDDPLESGTKIKLSQLADRLYTVTPEGSIVPKESGMLFKTVAKLNPNDARMLSSYTQLQKDEAELQADLMAAHRARRKPQAEVNDPAVQNTGVVAPAAQLNVNEAALRQSLPAALKRLRDNPGLAKDFDLRYGPIGESSEKYLGKLY